MLTPIEEFLWSGKAAHGVGEITLSPRRLVLALAPMGELVSTPSWRQLNSLVIAEFDDVRITSIDAAYGDVEDLELPWDIIGFDRQRISDGRWRFCLHTSGVEYVFESLWPRLLPR